jgi:hypothetical protein
MIANVCREITLSYSQSKQKMTSFRSKMTSPGGKLKALACHQTKKVNKVEDLTYLPTNIDDPFWDNKLF